MAIANPQQLNNSDRLTLRPALVGRITAFVANYALYIMGGGKNADPNVVNLKQWATNAIKNAASVADQVSWHVLDNPNFINGGTSIEEDDLKGAVETAMNERFVTPLS